MLIELASLWGNLQSTTILHYLLYESVFEVEVVDMVISELIEESQL